MRKVGFIVLAVAAGVMVIATSSYALMGGSTRPHGTNGARPLNQMGSECLSKTLQGLAANPLSMER